MNYRDLVNDFLIESSMDDQIATVEGQQDDALKATRWVRDAWVQIQRADRWSFMWRTMRLPLKKGQWYYTLEEQEREYGSHVVWETFRYNDGPFQEMPFNNKAIRYADVDAMRLILKGGAKSFGPPNFISKNPDESLFVSPIPDSDDYVIAADIYASPVFLTDDLDTPEMAPQWHKAIVWLALVNYAREQGKEWEGLYKSATREFNHIYSDMNRFYLADMKPTLPLVR